MSPRPGPRRPIVGVRIGENGLAWLDSEAERRGVNRSEMIRMCCAYAKQHMPKGWKP